jgi:FkbM family methyltransferase
MPARLFQLYYRLDVLAMKAAGKLPQLPWSDLASMLISSSIHWPVEKLLIPRESADGITLYDTPIGPVAHNTKDARILGLLVLEEMRGIYERGAVRVRRGDIVIDLGANVGTFTRFALAQGAAQVIAFEPEPRHVAILKLGFAREISDGRVVLVEAGAWKERATLQFHSAGLLSRLDAAGQISIPVVRIDDVVDELCLPRVDFIKADIEGAERHALEGAGRTLQKFGPRMALCVYHLPDDPEVIHNLAQSLFPYAVTRNASGTQAFFQPSKAAL